MLSETPKIVFFGAGVLGGSVGGWIAPHYDNLYFLDQGPVAAALKEKGITTYPGDDKAAKESVAVKVVDRIADAADADVVVIGVKNYSLDGAAKAIRDSLGDKPIIIGMQNGVENQKILPRYFSKVIYCVISYNAWMDEPGLIGYQKKGPLYFGTLHNELMPEMRRIAAIFNLGVETHITQRLNDAAHCKIVINLVNSVTTLIGFRYREISDRSIFQKLTTGITWEGVQILKAAGFKEVKLGGMPPWLLLRLGATMPSFMSKPIFEKNVKKMVLSSMSQDILQRKGQQSEIDTINGYMLSLADKYGVKAPVNRTVYELCKAGFAKPDFQPMDVKEVWAEVEKRK